MAGTERVERVVVLMLENRSFDHMLGHLDHGGLVPVGPEQRNAKDVSDPGGEWCEAHFLPGDEDVTVDPGHGFEDVVRQLTEADPSKTLPPLDHDRITNGGFAWNYAARLAKRRDDPARACDIMGCHTAERVPALSTLAREFAVCSRWFCSVPSETWPNRLFAHGAQSDGLIENVVRLYGHPTTFDVLSERATKRSWAVYGGDIPQALSYWEPADAFRDRFNPMKEFFTDVRDGTLPQYSFIEPKHFGDVNSQHPVHSVGLGDRLVHDVYTALASNPEIWRSVLLLITYDEHGGFFDREKPPRTVPPVAGVTDAEHGFAFDILGVRVPAVVVSPFVAAGTVDGDVVRDHASIVRTVFDALGVDRHLTERDAQAESVLGLLTLDDPREPPSLPAPPPERLTFLPEEAAPRPIAVDDLQLSLAQLVDVLDQQRGGIRLLENRGSARPPFESRDEIDDLIRHVQERHMGTREERLALE